MVTILGIHDGHNSGATLLQDGEITFSICEERLTRNKNEIGYPKNSINEVLKLGKVNPKELDKVVYSSNFTPPTAPFEGDDGGNVQLLMCKDKDPTIAEVNKSDAGGSGSNTITNNGGVTSSTENPFV